MQVLFFIAGIVIAGAVMVPMLLSRGKRIRELEARTEQSAGSASDFRNKTIKLAAAVRESAGLISLSGNPASGGDQTGSSIEKIEKTIDENARIAAEIVEKTRSVAVISSKMEEDVLNGFAVLEKNVRKMGDIKEKNSGVISGIISLGNKVNKIRDIVRVINTITDQTKVIAFNAALEAAGAGETGKRFAVVAAEVNRLADDIAVLTRQIREQVEEIQSSSASLIVYSEEGSDRIAEGYKLIKDLEDVFKEIKAGAEITSNQAQAITVSTQQQLKSSEKVSFAISEVSQEVKLFINSVETAALTAGTLAERTRELERFLTVQTTAQIAAQYAGKEAIGQGDYGG